MPRLVVICVSRPNMSPVSKEYVIQEVSLWKGEVAFVLKPSIVMIEATCSFMAPNQFEADSYLVPFNHCYSSFMLL